MNVQKTFDVIVVGGGHAGIEAAMASARLSANTLLLTHNLETLGQMSCNPAIGGIGKSHLVKEIDALGGVMAHAIDRAGIQFRLLNLRKGPAVRATRAQADRVLYKQVIRNFLENQPNLTLFQQAVDDLIIDRDRVFGIITQTGLRFSAKTVVLAVGTFLGGKIHIGANHYPGGRAGDLPANALARHLRALPFRVARLKTRTPTRLDGRTINFDALQRQCGDEPTPVFSFLGNPAEHPAQIPCYITHTNEHTHDIIRANLHQSPIFTGAIEGVGPRYCPSIEDKIVRFSDKTSHQIFIEPEGLGTHEVYPNGISTSLSIAVQEEFVRSIKGFEKTIITQPGYAIEYDFFDPRDLKPTLETKAIQGLFFAGQINGTTGYEEAGAQGLIAGLNAALQTQEKKGWYPRRDQAYIGVLIDDLITRGTQEPYRMFTSRAEHRLLLREDNADLRLTEIGRKLGLVNDHRWKLFETKRDGIEREKIRLKSIGIYPSELATKIIGAPLEREYKALDLLRRPEITYDKLLKFPAVAAQKIEKNIIEQIEIQVKYDGYVQRQLLDIEKRRKHEMTSLPTRMDYNEVPSLSNEVKQKLNQIKPITIGQASRIPGITPAAISILLVHLKKITHKLAVE